MADPLVRRGRLPAWVDLDLQTQFSTLTGSTARSGGNSIYSLFQRNLPLRELIRMFSNTV